MKQWTLLNDCFYISIHFNLSLQHFGHFLSERG